MTNKHKQAALARGKARSGDIDKKVRAAMKLIAAELETNGGTYPKGKRRMSKNEVARRAGISPSTFFSDKHENLGKEVTQWLRNLEAPSNEAPEDKKKRTDAARAEDWKRKFENLKSSHIQTELDLQQAEHEREKVLEELNKVKAENIELKRQLRFPTITS